MHALPLRAARHAPLVHLLPFPPMKNLFHPFLLLGIAALSVGCGGKKSDSVTVERPPIAGSSLAVPTATSLEDSLTHEPWSTGELLAPSTLAAQLAKGGAPPVVFDMGSAGTIKGARKIGPAQETESLTKLLEAAAELPKNERVVVYCGCCPFAPCPNIRPAVRTLKEAGFTNVRLLNLPNNLKADWIDAGYPMAN